jgi:hypothetical protein
MGSVSRFRDATFTSLRIGLMGMGMGGGAFRRLCIVRTALMRIFCAQLSDAVSGDVEVVMVQLLKSHKAGDSPQDLEHGRKRVQK